MAGTDPFEKLASVIEGSVLCRSVTVTRVSGGTYDPATGGTTGTTTIGPLTLSADRQATQRFTRGGPGGTPIEMEETVFNFRAASVAATALGTINEGDVITQGNFSAAVAGVTQQADTAMLRAVCRSEKRTR